MSDDWGKHDKAIQAAYLALIDAVNARWDEWSAANPENARARKVAERISGLGEYEQRRVVIQGVPYTVGSAPMQHHVVAAGGQLMPAWGLWLNHAREALEAVDAP